MRPLTIPYDSAIVPYGQAPCFPSHTHTVVIQCPDNLVFTLHSKGGLREAKISEKCSNFESAFSCRFSKRHCTFLRFHISEQKIQTQKRIVSEAFPGGNTEIWKHGNARKWLHKTFPPFLRKCLHRNAEIRTETQKYGNAETWKCPSDIQKCRCRNSSRTSLVIRIGPVAHRQSTPFTKVWVAGSTPVRPVLWYTGVGKYGYAHGELNKSVLLCFTTRKNRLVFLIVQHFYLEQITFTKLLEYDRHDNNTIKLCHFSAICVKIGKIFAYFLTHV